MSEGRVDKGSFFRLSSPGQFRGYGKPESVYGPDIIYKSFIVSYLLACLLTYLRLGHKKLRR